MTEKGSGTPEKPGTLGKEHTHRDGTRGWDTHVGGKKVHIRRETEDNYGGSRSDKEASVIERLIKKFLKD
ncbi:MAG TPA: hypothetical protein VIV62_01500 [Chthoniobacterales bacterium]|jgi:hypothetical protein